MSVLDRLRKGFGWLFKRLAPRAAGEFACAECNQWERCGLAPSEECIARAAHLAARNEDPSAPAASMHW
ncbi:MAG: hypothetical protein IT537_04300 [Hyphomicrobiales bacterium]|nr:hypothetical protein [Hyphomicrobiales bacterium]